MKYEIVSYDVWGNDEEGYHANNAMLTGKRICMDASKASLCDRLGLKGPYKIEVDATNE